MDDQPLQSEPPPFALIIHGKEGDLVLRIKYDGNIELGEGVTLDKASTVFWEAVAHMVFTDRANLIAEIERLKCALLMALVSPDKESNE